MIVVGDGQSDVRNDEGFSFFFFFFGSKASVLNLGSST